MWQWWQQQCMRDLVCGSASPGLLCARDHLLLLCCTVLLLRAQMPQQKTKGKGKL